MGCARITRSSSGIRLFCRSPASQHPEYKYTVSPELSGSIRPQAETTQQRGARATMRRYTIAKTLTLFLGVLSVVARSLPERRSEINVRTSGGKQFDISTPSRLFLLPFSLPSLLSQSHTVNTRCRLLQTAPRGIGPCHGFGRRTQWRYSHRHLLYVPKHHLSKA